MSRNTILLKGDCLYKEAAAGGAITPGHLVMVNSSGNVVVNTANVANVPLPMFAFENELNGTGIGTAYASGERVTYIIPERGAEVYALVPAAAPAIVIGDFLVSSGDGTLKKDTAPAVAAGNVNRIVAIAKEAVDNSGGGSPARIKVEIV